MKQKHADDSPVTKKELTEVLKDYPTKKDLAKVLSDYPTKKDLAEVLNNYPTKKDLDERFSKFHKAFSAEMDHKFLLFEERIEQAFSVFTSRIITLIDPLLKELETRDQDRELTTAQTKSIKEDIADLKKRVTKLEHS
jgi:hypothetical protein